MKIYTTVRLPVAGKVRVASAGGGEASKDLAEVELNARRRAVRRAVVVDARRAAAQPKELKREERAAARAQRSERSRSKSLGRRSLHKVKEMFRHCWRRSQVVVRPHWRATVLREREHFVKYAQARSWHRKLVRPDT